LYLIAFYVTKEHADIVKKAMFNAGAGKIGNYEQCCWQTGGLGQFIPCEGASPTIGSVNQIETVTELKVEMVCTPSLIHEVITALKKAHPYEAPAYHVIKCEDI